MNKKNIILGGVLIVLIAFAFLWNGPMKRAQEKKGAEENFLSIINVGKMSRIEIAHGSSTVALEKTGDKWKVGGTKNFYVSQAAASDLETALSEASRKDLEIASANKERKETFSVDDKDGYRVKIEQGGQPVEFVVGKSAADFLGSYISRSGDDKTYKIGTDLNYVFARDEWRDSEIFSFMKERAAKVRFQYSNRQFTAEKKENKWSGTAPYKFNVNEEKINKFLGVLEGLKASKIPEQDFKGTGLEKHNIIIQVTGEGLDNTLMIGDCTKDKLCYAKRGSDDNIYLIDKAVRDELDKKIVDFK